MGKIKNAPIEADKGESSDYSLTEEEFNYIMNVNVAKNNIMQEYNRVMSAFLHYIACNRLQYESTDNLQFELDFDDTKHAVKIWKLGENLYTPEKPTE